jgi:SAM-dependent methyltransferase
MRMNSYIGKKILSIIRDGDYAHPGEEDAIELSFQYIQKDTNRSMLDIGCGRGGTAHYLNANGWGDVKGVDIDSDSVQYAKQQYKSLDFITCNVIDVSKHVNCQFDLVYMFNSFYVFDNQFAALDSLKKVSKTSSSLLIFDYIDRGDYSKEQIMEEASQFLPHPIKRSHLQNMLMKSGWFLTSITDISNEYEKWYSQFMDRVDFKREEIIQIGGDDAMETICRLYGGLLGSIQKGVLGGAIVKAQSSA